MKLCPTQNLSNKTQSFFIMGRFTKAESRHVKTGHHHAARKHGCGTLKCEIMKDSSGRQERKGLKSDVSSSGQQVRKGLRSDVSSS